MLQTLLMQSVTLIRVGDVTAGLGQSQAVNLPSLATTKVTTLPLSLCGTYRAYFTGEHQVQLLEPFKLRYKKDFVAVSLVYDRAQ